MQTMDTTQAQVRAQAQLAGRASGAMFFSVFGAAWLAGWAHNSGAATPWYAAIVVLALVLLGIARQRGRRYAAAKAQMAQTPERRRLVRFFNIVNAAQWTLILGLAFLLTRLGQGAWIIPTTIGVIGLHFLPLAYAFRNPPHYLTGAALIALAVLYPQFAAGGPTSPLGFLGAGLILWLSAAWALRPGHAPAGS